MAYLSTILKNLHIRLDCDLIDHLNYYYTPFMLITFAILVSAKQYVGYPIQCWVPAQFTEAMEQYTENYCWIQNTWWIPLSDQIPNVLDNREASQLTYYQWVPFILLLEAIMFYLSHMIWQKLSWKSNLHDMIEIAKRVSSFEDQGKRKKFISSLANHIESSTEIRRSKKEHMKRSCLIKFMSCNEMNGVQLWSYYLIVKILSIINIFLQFFMLAFFLGTQHETFGWKLFGDLIIGRQWNTSGVFPRVTMCDFEVKVMGNLHRHTVQCVLMINMFNEKIFLFLWFWFAFLLIATIVNAVYWFISVLRVESRYGFVKTKLLQFPDPPVDNDSLKNFCAKYLHLDDIFMLKMISNNSSDRVVSELLRKLYSSYNRNKLQNLTLSVYSNSLSSNYSYPSKRGTPANILVDLDRNENLSFKETLYQPLKPTNGKVHDDDEEHVLERFEQPNKKYSAVSATDRYMKKQKSWIGGKKLMLSDRRRLEKMSFTIGADNEDEMEGSGEDSV